MKLAPTPRTVRLAKALMRHTPAKGAEAAALALQNVERDQLVAFVHVLARYAAATTDELLPATNGKRRPLPDLPGVSSRAVKGLRFTEEERRAAQRRYSLGDRSPRTRAARNEYQRLWRQDAAARKARAAQDGSAA